MALHANAVGPEHVNAIGRIVVNFALLEQMTRVFVWKLIFGENDKLSGSQQLIGEIVTAELSFSRLLWLASSLLNERFADPRIVKEFEGLKKRAEAVNEARNTVVHSVWGANPETNVSVRLKSTAKKRLKRAIEETTVDKLWTIANEVAEVSDQMTQFTQELEF